MSRFLEFTLITFLSLALLLAVSISATIGWRPFLGPRTRPITAHTFERTPARLARGGYLFNSVSACVDCHTPHDWTNPEAPPAPGVIGAGEVMPLNDLPGTVVASNLTPDRDTGLGQWSDDEIARAIREGVDRNGRTLFPLMPYEQYHRMSDEDVASLVVFLRALPPTRNPLPETQIIFPVRYLIRGVPQPITSPVPSLTDSATPEKRGEYLVALGGCRDCHTPAKRGAPIKSVDLGGGFILDGPWGRVAGANITSDPSGIGYYDEQLFRDVMRTGYVRARKLNQIMPWAYYRGMTDQDISDIFAYLKSVPAVKHRVDNTEAATMCPKCGAKHGLGDKN
jgi:mono/diheme cytochrome c family protein